MLLKDFSFTTLMLGRTSFLLIAKEDGAAPARRRGQLQEPSRRSSLCDGSRKDHLTLPHQGFVILDMIELIVQYF